MCRLLLLRLHNWSPKTGFRIWNVSSTPQGTHTSKAGIIGSGPLWEVLGCYQLNPLFVRVITVMRVMRVICSWGVCAAGFLQLFGFGSTWSCLFTNDSVEKWQIALINHHISNLPRMFFIKQTQKQLGNWSPDVSFSSAWPSVCIMNSWSISSWGVT